MAKYAAYGAKLQYLVSAVWTDIAGVRDISGPGMKADQIDVTAHDSPGGVREFIKSLIDGGEVSFQLVWDPEDIAGQKALQDRMLVISADAVDSYRLVFPTANSKTWQFTGFVSAFEPDLAVEGEIASAVTIKVTGLPDYNAA